MARATDHRCHEKLFRDNGTTEIYLALDNDATGAEATEQPEKEILPPLRETDPASNGAEGVKDANDFSSAVQRPIFEKQCLELIESNAPVLALNLAALPTAEETGAGRAPEVNPLKLLSLLDKAKAFPLLKAQQPEIVADVGFTTYDGKPLVSDFNDYQIQIEAAFRFNAEDTLVFRATITNATDTPLIYQPDSFSLRAGNRLYPQSISDASGMVPPKGKSIVYFAVTGTPDGGRNDLSLKNQFTVLVNRLSPPPPPPPVVTTTNAPVHPIRSPRNQP